MYLYFDLDNRLRRYKIFRRHQCNVYTDGTNGEHAAYIPAWVPTIKPTLLRKKPAKMLVYQSHNDVGRLSYNGEQCKYTLCASQLVFLVSFVCLQFKRMFSSQRGYRKANLDAHKIIFKMSAILKVVYNVYGRSV